MLEGEPIIGRRFLPHLWGALTSRLDALVEVLPEAIVREAAGVELCPELPHSQLAQRNDVPPLVHNAVPHADELPINLDETTGQEEHGVRSYSCLNVRCNILMTHVETERLTSRIVGSSQPPRCPAPVLHPLLGLCIPRLPPAPGFPQHPFVLRKGSIDVFVHGKLNT